MPFLFLRTYALSSHQSKELRKNSVVFAYFGPLSSKAHPTHIANGSDLRGGTTTRTRPSTSDSRRQVRSDRKSPHPWTWTGPQSKSRKRVGPSSGVPHTSPRHRPHVVSMAPPRRVLSLRARTSINPAHWTRPFHFRLYFPAPQFKSAV